MPERDERAADAGGIHVKSKRRKNILTDSLVNDPRNQTEKFRDDCSPVMVRMLKGDAHCLERHSA